MISSIKTLIPKSKSCGYLLGQFWVLHAWDAVLLPEHVLPPLAGAGSVQVRVRLWVPDPHVTEQEVQEPQSAQLPFTITMVRKISVLFSFFKRSLFVWIESNILCSFDHTSGMEISIQYILLISCIQLWSIRILRISFLCTGFVRCGGWWRMERFLVINCNISLTFLLILQSYYT